MFIKNFSTERSICSVKTTGSLAGKARTNDEWIDGGRPHLCLEAIIDERLLLEHMPEHLPVFNRIHLRTESNEATSLKLNTVTTLIKKYFLKLNRKSFTLKMCILLLL